MNAQSGEMTELYREVIADHAKTAAEFSARCPDAHHRAEGKQSGVWGQADHLAESVQRHCC